MFSKGKTAERLPVILHYKHFQEFVVNDASDVFFWEENVLKCWQKSKQMMVRREQVGYWFASKNEI